jgi:hypothetical protein
MFAGFAEIIERKEFLGCGGWISTTDLWVMNERT